MSLVPMAAVLVGEAGKADTGTVDNIRGWVEVDSLQVPWVGGAFGVPSHCTTCCREQGVTLPASTTSTTCWVDVE